MQITEYKMEQIFNLQHAPFIVHHYAPTAE
jgi:hypothetical protein